MPRTLKEVAPNLHSTEAEFDKPKPGDVRIEEGVARVDGEVMHAQVEHVRSGQLMRAAAHTVGPEFKLVRQEERAHKVYKFVERPLSGEYGLYAHEDNTPDHATRTKDEEGFILVNGERQARYLKPLYNEDGSIQYTDESRQRIACEPDPHYWELVEEHPDAEKALEAAKAHL
jgi:hypothetical protein